MTEIMCFPSGHRQADMGGRNPKSPGPLGKVVPAVPGSSRNCKIQGVSSVLAKWPAGATVQSQAQAGHLSTADSAGVGQRGQFRFLNRQLVLPVSTMSQ